MTSTPLVPLLLCRAERPDSTPTGALPPPLQASIAEGWHPPRRLETTGLALLLYPGQVRWRFGGKQHVHPGEQASLRVAHVH